jgi:co-chaperonin GroES (HSP10)
MSTKIMPLGIKVREIKKEKPKEGLIIIPDTVKITSRFKEGIVVQVGEGTEDKPMEVEVNDKLLYKKEIYPATDGCDIITMEEVLYIVGKKCANELCKNDAIPNTKYCHNCYNEMFED